MIRLDRLEKLAQHMESGKLGHDRFDITKFHDRNDCGTVGCMLGECPTVFPGDWEWHGGVFDAPVTIGNEDTDRSAARFFGISDSNAGFLFYDSTNFDGFLPPSATRGQAAAHLRAFIESHRGEGSR